MHRSHASLRPAAGLPQQPYTTQPHHAYAATPWWRCRNHAAMHVRQQRQQAAARHARPPFYHARLEMQSRGLPIDSHTQDIKTRQSTLGCAALGDGAAPLPPPARRAAALGCHRRSMCGGSVHRSRSRKANTFESLGVVLRDEPQGITCEDFHGPAGGEACRKRGTPPRGSQARAMNQHGHVTRRHRQQRHPLTRPAVA